MADLLYGRNAVREALRAGRRSFERLTVSAGAQEAGTLGEVMRLAEKAEVPILRVDRHELDRRESTFMTSNLIGVRAKLARAQKHIDEFDAAFFAHPSIGTKVEMESMRKEAGNQADKV